MTNTPTTTEPTPRAAHWENVRTDDGWHLRLVGANGEIVLVSEDHPDKRDSVHALDLVRRTIPGWREDASTMLLEEVDER